MTPGSEDSPFMSTADAAAFLHVRPRTLEMWRRLGTGPRFTRLGRRAYYTKAWLVEWAEARSRTSTAEEAMTQ